MPANVEQTTAAITPGSTEYGERGQLESDISQLLSGGGGPQPPTPGVTPQQAPGGAGDPLAAMLSGSVPGAGSGPLTSGLSVGPGAGGEVPPAPPSNEIQALQRVALGAKSPQLRAMARVALRRRVRSQEHL